jgi:hypothetical protein
VAAGGFWFFTIISDLVNPCWQFNNNLIVATDIKCATNSQRQRNGEEKQPEKTVVEVSFLSFLCSTGLDLSVARTVMEVVTPTSFEAANGQRRKRRSRPCDACRKKKTRCVLEGDATRCVHCQLRDSACTFQRVPRSTKSSTPSRDGTAEDNETRGNADTSHRQRSRPIQQAADSKRGRAKSPINGSNHSLNGQADLTLGLCRTRFAELYGLGSDMEPILMVCVFFANPFKLLTFVASPAVRSSDPGVSSGDSFDSPGT